MERAADVRDLVLRHLAEVEPLLRATCTHEIDATQPVEDVVAELVATGGGVESQERDRHLCQPRGNVPDRGAAS
jgi:hypothetical protein